MMRRGLLLLLLALTSAHAAELGDEPMSIDFDYSEIDMRKDEYQLTGNVRISQGPMSITSDSATAEGASQRENSRWTFERNVHVRTADADLRANTAIARVMNGAIANATVKGSPAVFEQRKAGDDKQIRGRAGQIEYDFVKGIVRMTNDVWFSYGDNEFRGAAVVYNVRDERVVVNPEGANQGRVNITVRPKPASERARESGTVREAETSTP